MGYVHEWRRCCTKTNTHAAVFSLTPLKDVSGRAAEQFLDAACVVLLSRVEERNVVYAEKKEKKQTFLKVLRMNKAIWPGQWEANSCTIHKKQQRQSLWSFIYGWKWKNTASVISPLGIKQKGLIQHLVPSFLVLKAKPQLTPPVVELAGSRSGQRRRHGHLMSHTVRNHR